ncbi:MAG: VOC family protein [Bdellovibrionales bacterium]|jgi:predicted enzyme related to lactoylglutathione lyase|nr:VOC family protein [Bdellovibrionales bacterium]
MGLVQGNFCWFEIPTFDFEMSKEFYSQLFGWTFQQETAFSNDYWFIATSEKAIGGGLYRGEPNGTTGIIPYFVVSDMGEALRKAEAICGRLVKSKTLITQDYGYFAHLHDNVGNLIAFWSES